MSPEVATDLAARAFVRSLQPFRCTLTYAQSLDARIAGADGRPVTLSCPESFRVTHELRRQHDIILIGVGTAINDNPGLNAREESGEAFLLNEQPIPVILDPNGRLQLTHEAKLSKNAQAGLGKKPIQLVHISRKDTFETCAEVLYIEEGTVREGRVQLEWSTILDKLMTLGDSVMIEGGANVISGVLRESAADLVVITSSPVFLGQGIVVNPDVRVELDDVRIQQFGRDAVIAGKLRTRIDPKSSINHEQIS